MSTLAVHPAARAAHRLPRWLAPSLSDCLFLAILYWVFATGSGWSVLLADGDTGWHIRTGDYILDTHTVPMRDLFSFSKPAEVWFAWEWLADLVFAILHRFWGLKGVVVFTGLVLSFATTLLFRHMVWRGANLLAAILATLMAVGASTVHYLARPHIFTLLGLTMTLWMLDRDRRIPRGAVWWLVPMTLVWTNLHGGFLAGLACIWIAVAERAWDATISPEAPNRFAELRRYALLAAACSLTTLANPYGWRLHEHMARYLSSPWIRQVVDEFQSPRFRSESMLQFEMLLFAGLAIVPVLCRKREVAAALLVVFWAHSALVSARHVPLYAIAAAPLCAAEASRRWAVWTAVLSPRSVVGTLRDCLRDFSRAPLHTSVWAPLVLLSLAGLNWDLPRDFPSNKFPVAACNRNAGLIAPPHGPMPRILTSDQWGDYLIYSLYPRSRVFVDGRSDFYGPSVGRDYLDLMNAGPNWARLIQSYRFDLALVPIEWPLAQLLMRDGNWRVRYLDRQAILLERRDVAGLNKRPNSTESMDGG